MEVQLDFTRICWTTKKTILSEYSFLPYKSKPQHLVIGEPIDVDRVEDPSEEQVSALHERYKAAIAKVFEENKRQLGHERYSLNVV